jgi:hypothetical protein
MALHIDQQGHDELHGVLMTRLQQAAEAAGWKGISITGTPSASSVKGDIVMSLDMADDSEDAEGNSEFQATITSHIIDAAVKARAAYAGDILVAADVEWTISTDMASLCLSYHTATASAWVKASSAGDGFWKGLAVVLASVALLFPAVGYVAYGHL